VEVRMIRTRGVRWTLAIAATLALAVQAREGVEVGKNSAFADLVPAEEVEKAAVQQYRALQQQASQRRALLAGKHRQVQRLQRIADRIIPLALAWNPRARGWKWEVSVIDAPEINAFCMPGGKIAFYTGLLDKLALTDDEVAMVMGHEIAHALREHARERMGKSAVTRSAAQLGGALLAGILGIDPRITDTVARGGATLLTLEFSRDDESEADLVGMELAARAGYDPRAGVSLWQKMGRLDKESPPQWLSTHPSGNNRIAEIKKNLPHVLPLYERARQSESTAPDIVPAR